MHREDVAANSREVLASLPPGVTLVAAAKTRSTDEVRHLSMGMSDSYVLALSEGATVVRIGTRLFGPRAQVER